VEEAKREEEVREVRRARTPAPAPVASPPVLVAPMVPPAPPVPPISAASVDRSKNNPFNRLISGGASPVAPPPPPANDGNNPFFRSQPAPTPFTTNNSDTIAPSAPPILNLPPAPPGPPAPKSPMPVSKSPAPPTSKSPAPPVVKTSYHTAPGDSEDEWGQEKDGDDSSEDELDSSRDTRDKLARQLFGSILPPASVPARPQSAAAGASATPKAPSPTSLSASTSPPPPPPPGPPAPPAPVAPFVSVAPAPTGDRSALLGSIQSGARLRKAVTNDRSASAFTGRVLGDVAPPSHINTTPSVPPAEALHPENNAHHSRQSVDWYMGLAADQGSHASQVPSLPPMGEEDEEQARKEMNGHVAPVPVIQVAHAEEVVSDLLDDIDRSIGMLP
jgi:hypothetical protein